MSVLTILAKVYYIKDPLKGDDKTVIRIEGKREKIKDYDWYNFNLNFFIL